jgi:aryl-alcohol dehydrogenase-like predicted oxidoreductase
MRYRTFGRTGWEVSEIGYGMWGLAGWSGSDDAVTRQALQLAVDGGCNFFDTAFAYGEGRSERLLGELVRANAGARLYTATKVPPKNRKWPSQRDFKLEDVFPADYIREYASRSLDNLNLPGVDLLQFHVWEDAWATDERWQRAIADLKQQGMIRAVGVSVNRWEPTNVLRTLETGLIDAVQVIYNIFDQSPEDALFSACRKHQVAVIARVPFDEGSLVGYLTKETRFPADDWRSGYFNPANLAATVERIETLRPLVPAGMTMAEMALRFILSNADVATVIPGMRQPGNVRANLAASTAGPLAADLVKRLRGHRWDRTPTAWSQ